MSKTKSIESKDSEEIQNINNAIDLDSEQGLSWKRVSVVMQDRMVFPFDKILCGIQRDNKIPDGVMGMKKCKTCMTEREKSVLDRYAEWVDFRKKDGLISDPMDRLNLTLWLHYNDPDMQKHVDHLLDLLYANYNL